MIVNLYSVYDRKAKEFSMPQNFKNHECAKRWFCNVMKECELIKNDMELIFVGTFENENGNFESACESIFCGYDVQSVEEKVGNDYEEEIQA